MCEEIRQLPSSNGPHPLRAVYKYCQMSEVSFDTILGLRHMCVAPPLHSASESTAGAAAQSALYLRSTEPCSPKRFKFSTHPIWITERHSYTVTRRASSTHQDTRHIRQTQRPPIFRRIAGQPGRCHRRAVRAIPGSSAAAAAMRHDMGRPAASARTRRTQGY